MFIASNITKEITVFYEDGLLDPINYAPAIEKVVIGGVFVDFEHGKNKDTGLNTSDVGVFLCLPINKNHAGLKINSKFVVGVVDTDLTTITEIEKELGKDNVFTITKIDYKDFGFNPHLEIYGK